MATFLATSARVLVVDDQAAARKALADKLRGIGYEVTAVRGGDEALEQINKLHFDLILSDFSMPKIDGMSLLRALRKNEIDLPFILLSEQPVANPLSVGARGMLFQLTKPVETGALEDTSRRAIELHRMVSRMRSAIGTFRNSPASQVEVAAVSATDARNEFASVLDQAMRRGVVIISKQNAPRAVLLSFEEFSALLERPARKLETLGEEFDAMLARMQTPRARKGMKAAFAATPFQLGAAAVAGARKRKKRG